MPLQAKLGRLFDVHVAFRPKGPDELFERMVAVVLPSVATALWTSLVAGEIFFLISKN